MAQVYDYLSDHSWSDVCAADRETIKHLLLDLVGVGLGGAQTRLSAIIRDHAARHFGGAAATMLFDGRQASAAGAALAGGMTIDALDGHDGQKLTKGHVGCALLPAVLAMSEAERVRDPRAFLAALVAGYEVGSRAGIALHTSVPDYHTSGAWMAVAIAGVGARLLGLGRGGMREAMGIAEYHGPRSQMMRCIDHPTMVKDGSGWGAMAGVSAAYLAADGFTGAPAITLDGADVADIWADLGQRSYLQEQYIKLFPVCRWAQPPLQAVLDLRATYGLRSEDVARIEVSTFHESVRLAVRHPETTEQAQYSTAYPTAVAMVRGQVGAFEVSQAAFGDPEVKRLAESVVFEEFGAYNDAFPEYRRAHVTLVLRDGRQLKSETTEALGDPEASLTSAEIEAKFRGLADPILGAQHGAELAQLILTLDQADDLEPLRGALHRSL